MSFWKFNLTAKNVDVSFNQVFLIFLLEAMVAELKISQAFFGEGLAVESLRYEGLDT